MKKSILLSLLLSAFSLNSFAGSETMEESCAKFGGNYIKNTKVKSFEIGTILTFTSTPTVNRYGFITHFEGSDEHFFMILGEKLPLAGSSPEQETDEQNEFVYREEIAATVRHAKTYGLPVNACVSNSYLFSIGLS